MWTNSPTNEQDGKPRLIQMYRGEHIAVFMVEDFVNGSKRCQYGLFHDGDPVLVRPFTTAEAMAAEIKGFAAALKSENAPQQGKARAADLGLPREFATVVVGVWGDKNPPYKNQWLNVPRGALDPENRLLRPCHRAEPRAATDKPLYIVAKKVRDKPELAVLEGWSTSLQTALEKAQVLDFQQLLAELWVGPKPPQEPKAKQTKEQVHEAREQAPRQEKAQEAPQYFWPVVTYLSPGFSEETAFVTVVELFPSREEALEFCKGKENLAVHPNWFKPGELERNVRITAWLDPEPVGENAEKLNRIIKGNLKPEQEPEQPAEAKAPTKDQTQSQPTAGDGLHWNAFRPTLLERPPTPTLENRVWVVVSVVGLHGENGATFKVEKVLKTHPAAEWATRRPWRSDLAVFPRSFDANEIKQGDWFTVDSVEGYANDKGAQKIRELIQKKRDLTQAPKPPEQGPSLAI